MKPEDLKPGLKVRHYQGGEYEIVGIGGHFRNLAQCVVYRRPGDAKLIVQDMHGELYGFCGDIEPGVPRFTVIPEEQP